MNDTELLQALKMNMKRERKGQAEFLRYLAEVDVRQLFRPQYSSLFQFCVEELGLSAASTCKRTQVARLSRQYPEILEKIASGKLTMTNASLIAPKVTEENHQELIAEAQGKSKFDLQKKLAPTFASECKEKVKPISQSRTMFVFSGDEETVALYKALQDRLRHKYPQGKLEELVKEAFQVLLEKTNPAREPQRKVPPKPIKHSRYVPAHIKRLVWQRDGGTCTEILPTGIRCGSRAFVEIDHLVPWSMGGSSQDSLNLALRCRSHNQYKGGARIPSGPPRG